VSRIDAFASASATRVFPSVQQFVYVSRSRRSRSKSAPDIVGINVVPASQPLRVERFVVADASEADLRMRFELEDLLLRERDPDAETLPHDRRLELLRGGQPPYSLAVETWIVRGPDGRYVAIGWLGTHTPVAPGASPGCHVLIGVHPQFRRRGVGTGLVRELVRYADGQGFEVIESIWIDDAARGFAGYLRGSSSMPRDGHRIPLSEVEWPVLRGWIDDARARAADFRVDALHDVLPEASMGDFLCAWTQLQTSEPAASVQARIGEITRRWHDQERLRVPSGERRFSLVIRSGDDRIGALLEAIYNPAAPKVLLVRVCGVLDGYGGLGLRKWLQAELLVRLRDQFPAVEHVVFRHPPTQIGAAPDAPHAGPSRFRVKEVLRRLR
jgi:GNAT superfamily N-acetyltransferase